MSAETTTTTDPGVIAEWELPADATEATIKKLKAANRRAERKGLVGRYSWEITKTYRTPQWDRDRLAAELAARGVPVRWEIYLTEVDGALTEVSRPEWEGIQDEDERGNVIREAAINTAGDLVEIFPHGWAEYHTLTVTGSMPEFGGWAFIGVTKEDGTGALVIRTHPAYDGPAIPRESLRHGECDECGTVRNRMTVYLVRNAETGEVRQVGGQCVMDYTGVLVGAADLSDDAVARIGEALPGPSVTFHQVADIIALAAAAGRRWGLISAAEARSAAGPMNSTADRVRLHLDGTKGIRPARGDYRSPAQIYAEDRMITVEPEDIETAADVCRWVLAEQPGRSTYLDNLREVVSVGMVGPSNLALLVSAVKSYRRALETAAERETRERLAAERAARREQAATAYVGTEGKREEFTLTVVRIGWQSNYAGTDNIPIYNFEDVDGRRVVWFASRDLGWEVGQTVTVKATVKSHGTARVWVGNDGKERGGHAETVITRATEVQTAAA